MFRRITADDSRFKSVLFHEGVNLLLADRVSSSSDTDTRNSAGKSSLIEILHFLLGSKVDKNSLLSRSEVRETQFTLELDWPGVDVPLSVSRIPSSSNQIFLNPNVIRRDAGNSLLGVETLPEWQRSIERDLFGLPDEHPGVSGRALLSLYMRRIGSNAFNEAVKSNPQQSPAEATANVAYLLGLDWQLAARYRELAAREATRRRLVRASKDPVWGKIVGRSAELRGQIVSAERRVEELSRQVESFRVVPEYENLQRQADELGERIRQTRVDDAIDRRNLQDLERALVDAEDPEVDYLEEVYSELGVNLPEMVRRRYEEVREFHSSVVRNRRIYLEGEVEALQERLSTREAERVSLGEQQAALMRTLNEGGALQALTALQQSLAQEQAALEALRHRFEAAQTLEASAAEIKASRSQLEAEIRADLRERERIINEVNLRFLEYATRLYGSGRNAYLDIDPSPTHLKIAPHIDSQDSRGIQNMVIFCFDLTMAVTAHRAGRGPGFLVHDSHLFDGVDERQVSRAFRLAREVCESEQLQYLVTLNSDDYETKVVAQGVDLSDSIIEPRLTDEFDEGGLFGFRF